MSNRMTEFQLGEWRVTPLRGVIHGSNDTRRITPKAMDVLTCLANHAGEVVERDTFLEEVWHGRAFSDEPLNKCIAELRKKLGDSAGSRDYIETIPKRGYRLIAEMTPIGAEPAAAKPTEMRRSFRGLLVVGIALLAAFVGWHLSKLPMASDNVSIAVLPFDNLSSDDKAHFADGVHEELIGILSYNDDLAVRSRTSTLRYRDSAGVPAANRGRAGCRYYCGGQCAPGWRHDSRNGTGYSGGRR